MNEDLVVRLLAANDKLARVTLASALISTRGDASVQGAQEALIDADHLLATDRNSSRHKAWQEKHSPKTS